MYNSEKNDKEKILQLITFSVDKEEYGIGVLEVEEVIRLPEVQKLPKSPPWLKGIISLRGEVIPIVDLRIKFGLPENQTDNYKRCINVSINEKKVGMIVDKVSKVIRVPRDEIKEAPNFSSYVSHEYIRGIITMKERMIILLDVGFIFSDEEMSHISTAAGAAVK